MTDEFDVGVQDELEKEQKLPDSEQYIRHMSSTQMGNGMTNVILGMTKFHAELKHTVDCLVVDFTYKRVHGIWKEFEVIGWDSRHQKRM